MAKLFSATKKLFPVEGADGVFIQDPTFEILDTLQSLKEKRELDAIIYMCEHIIRDKDGEKFEDIDEESLRSGPGFLHVAELLVAVSNTLHSVMEGGVGNVMKRAKRTSRGRSKRT